MPPPPSAPPASPRHPAPVRIDACNGPWPLHDAQTSRQVEQEALGRHPPHCLMARAGLSVARLALAVAPHAPRIQVWVGTGHNAGDGLVAAHHLHLAGKPVQVHGAGDLARLPPDAAWALHQALAAGVTVTAAGAFEAAACLDPHDLVIDALLDLGAQRAPDGRWAAAIAAINAGRAPVLAIDLPSGLNPDTGVVLGDAAVRAGHTLALLTLKPGCHTGAGRDHAGAVWFDPLGMDAAAPTSWLSGPATGQPRSHSAHKGSHGDVAVVGGSAGMAGAAWLAARAALAAGAGRVFCSLLDAAAPALDPQQPELMGRRAWWESPPAVLAATTVACGCGGGDAVREALPPLLSRVPRLVLDADALNAIANDNGLRTLLRQRAGRGLATLLTPHPLEAARLLGLTATAVQRDRLAAAQALTSAMQCAVLLKGSGSVITAPNRLPRINPTGNAALASAGTGDVLAGWAAGLWAQDAGADPSDIAARAAWQHGRAADLWPAAARGAPLCASDLVRALAARRGH